MSFDSLGRLAVIHQGAYVVLNDTTWIDIADKKVSGAKMQNVVFGLNGDAYYGAFGTWGVVEFTAEGLMGPRPLLPTSFPKWVMASNFTDIVPTAKSVAASASEWTAQPFSGASRSYSSWLPA